MAQTGSFQRERLPWEQRWQGLELLLTGEELGPGEGFWASLRSYQADSQAGIPQVLLSVPAWVKHEIEWVPRGGVTG